MFKKLIEIKSGCGAKIAGSDLTCGQRITSEMTIPVQKLILLNNNSKHNNIVAEPFKINLIPPIQIELEKHNSASASTDKLLNAKFNVIARQDKEEIYNKDIQTTNGKLNISINPKGKNPVYVTITEKEAPAGYRTIDPICIKYVLSSNNKVWNLGISNVRNWVEDSGFESYSGWTYIDDGNTKLPNIYQSNNTGDKIYVDQDENTKIYTLKVYNEPKIDLKLIKVDNNDRNLKLKGAKFSGKISGVNSLKYKGITYTKNSAGIIDFAGLELVTDNNGEIKTTFEDIVFEGESTTIVITIEEVEIPNSNTDAWYYKKLDYPITINITFTKSDGITNINWQKNGNTEDISVVKTGEKVIEITVPNKRLIDISGKVWLDGNTGIKPVVGPDGKMGDNEEALEGIIVELVGMGYPVETKTDKNGQYEFNKLDYGPEYSIKFTYDGINYEDTTYYKDAQGNIIGDSKAQENADDRTKFNNKFKTIEKGKATNSGIKLEYTTTENQESKSSTSKLNTYNTKNGRLNVNDFGMTATAETNYKMEDNENHSISTKNINFGLVKRGTDLALSTSLTDAKVTINGKETTSKVQEKDEQTVLAIGKESKPAETTYNLNLYSSDYNYRIKNYISQEKFSHLQNNNEETQYKTGDILRVYVTYQLSLQNQSVKDATINEVEYHYDKKYKFSKIVNKKGDEIKELEATDDPNNCTIKIKNIQLAGLATSDTENTENIEKIKKGELHTTENFYLVFEVKHKIKDEKETEIELGNFINTAEITSYSTDDGLIDVDSAPGNCEDGRRNT